MKKFLTMLIILIAALALLSPPFPATAQEPNPLEMNKAIARRYIEELFTQGNLDVADELVAEDFVNHSPFGEEDTGDREGLKQAASGFLASFPDGQFVIDDMIAEGDLVAMRGTGRGTHTGEPFAGVAATGAEYPEDFELRESYNVAPTTDVPILLERVVEGEIRRQLHIARWGLVPRWAKDLKVGLFREQPAVAAG